MLVVSLTHCREANLYTAELIAIHDIFFSADHKGGLQTRITQVGTRVKCWHNRNTASHRIEPQMKRGRFWGAGRIEAGNRAMPAITSEQVLYSLFQAPRQIISCSDINRCDNEVSLRCWMPVDLRMPLDREVFTCTKVAYASFACKTLRIELLALHTQPALAVQFFVITSYMGRFDNKLLHASSQLVAQWALVGHAWNLGMHKIDIC